MVSSAAGSAAQVDSRAGVDAEAGGVDHRAESRQRDDNQDDPVAGPKHRRHIGRGRGKATFCGDRGPVRQQAFWSRGGSAAIERRAPAPIQSNEAPGSAAGSAGLIGAVSSRSSMACGTATTAAAGAVGPDLFEVARSGGGSAAVVRERRPLARRQPLASGRWASHCRSRPEVQPLANMICRAHPHAIAPPTRRRRGLPRRPGATCGCGRVAEAVTRRRHFAGSVGSLSESA